MNILLYLVNFSKHFVMIQENEHTKPETELSSLKEMIKHVEEHTGAVFDLSNRRHRMLLSGIIERMIARHDAMVSGISLLISGDHNSTFNRHRHRLHKIPGTND